MAPSSTLEPITNIYDGPVRDAKNPGTTRVSVLLTIAAVSSSEYQVKFDGVIKEGFDDIKPRKFAGKFKVGLDDNAEVNALNEAEEQIKKWLDVKELSMEGDWQHAPRPLKRPKK